MNMFSPFGPIAVRRMLKRATETADDRWQRVKDRQLQHRLDRDAQAHCATGNAKPAAIFSILAPLLSLSLVFFVYPQLRGSRTGALIGLVSTLLIFGGLASGALALLSAQRHRVRGVWGIAMTGTVICALLSLFIVLATVAGRSYRGRVQQPLPHSQPTP